MRTAVYPGSFDPVTNGHIDIVNRALKILDRIYVAVIKNPEKEPLFSLDERVEMLKESFKGNDKVIVESFDGLLVDYAKKKKVDVIIRGLRAVSDFDYEFQMALTNLKLCSDIETVFIMTDHQYSYLSSSLVKQIARLGGDVGSFVPGNVKTKLVKGRK
ncbi:pantetheine-phosphate adenylyltransferase [Candidatus Margulisiibacteriota bacterium]